MTVLNAGRSEETIMWRSVISVVDRWVGRRADPKPDAVAAVSGLKPAVVITGASRGIGFALADRFARAGRDVVMIARHEAPLIEAAGAIAKRRGVSAIALSVDVTQPEAQHTIDAALASRGFYMDVLINNAGVGLAGSFEDQRAEDLDALVALNVAALTRMTRHAVGAMLARGRGGVLNVGSLGGMVPGPYQAAYYASKAYVASLTEAVGHEARGRGVRVSVVAPGPVETDFHAKMGAETSLYRMLVPSLAPEAVAARAYRGFMLGETVIVPGLLPSAGGLALKLLPHLVSVPLVAALLSVGARGGKDARDRR